MNRTEDLFHRVWSGRPDGTWAAPGRANLIGEHTDYNNGLVFPFALAQDTEAAVGLRDHGLIRICSAQQPGDVVEIAIDDVVPGRIGGWGGYVAGTLWAMGSEQGCDIAIDSEVPVGSGLSSSAALICAVALATNDLLALGMSRRELARRGQLAENDFVGAPTGGMDQMASMLCTQGHALLYDVRADTTTQVPFDPGVDDLVILVTDTRVHHGHADGEYASRRRDCEDAAAQLGVPSLREIDIDQLDDALRLLETDRVRRRARHVVTENQRVKDMAAALAWRDWEEAGRLLTRAHQSIRDDFEASCPELDLAVATLLRNGALGARMTGGGFGGATICLVPRDLATTAQTAVATAFHDAGFAAPDSFTVVPSAGARRIA